MEMGSFDIRALATLLRETEESDSDLDNSVPHQSSIHPGAIGSPFTGEKKSSSQKKVTNDDTNRSITEINQGKQTALDIGKKDNIRLSGEISEGTSGRNDGVKIPDISSDPRQRPVVDIKYKQDLSTEDVFLGMSSKTPGAGSCEWILIKISMPGETDHNTFQLDLKDNWIELRSNIYVLVHVLPYRIDPRLGNAKWDKNNSTLTLTLRIIKDLDIFNDL